MKTFYKTLVLLFLTAIAITNLHAQSSEVIIRLKQPPPNLMGVGNMWDLTLDNTTGSDMKIYLVGTASEDKDGLIIEGKSKVFTIKPGKTSYKYNDFSGAEIKYNNGKYKEIILRTGNAPEGNYTICVTAFDESGAEVGRENCITQPVQQTGSITLISPDDGAELSADGIDVVVIWPKFVWTPLPGAKDYTLRIVELKGDQSPEVAMKTNKLIYEKKGITTTSTQYHYEKSYPNADGNLEGLAWMVSSGNVKSEVYTINIKKKDSNKITLLYPYDGGEVGTDTLMFKWNRNDPCPPHVLCNYTLRIVELKGSQSPDEAFKENIPILEKTGITETSFKYRFGISKPGVKIAWQVSSGDEVSEYAFINTSRDNIKRISLTSPKNGEEIDIKKNIPFEWAGSEEGPFTLKIVEIKGSQSPPEAMKSNETAYELKGITTTSTIEPYIGIDKPGIKISSGLFAWQITSENFRSDVYTIKIVGNDTSSSIIVETITDASPVYINSLVDEKKFYLADFISSDSLFIYYKVTDIEFEKKSIKYDKNKMMIVLSDSNQPLQSYGGISRCCLKRHWWSSCEWTYVWCSGMTKADCCDRFKVTPSGYGIEKPGVK